ncbi:MAG: hypothetical protein ACE14Q_01940 [Acidobacteriota bacterium]
MVRLIKEERRSRKWPNVRGDPKVAKKIETKLVLLSILKEMKEVKR